MSDFKSGFVTVVGRPNVGKSTFLNKIMGEKILIESSRPQATRNKIHCVYTEERGQVVFLDTPGIHRPHHKLGEVLVEYAQRSLQGVDIIIFMVEPDRVIGAGDRHVANLVKNTGKPTVLCINKIDSVSPSELIPILEEWHTVFGFSDVIPISAKTGEGIERLLDLVFANLNEGPQYYPNDMITDRPEEFLISEMIREKVFNRTKEEVPYAVAVSIRVMEDRGDTLYIAADIFVERSSQKGIIIGKQGKMLKAIGQDARKDIERFMGYKVYLDLHVRHKNDWRNKSDMLNLLGYNKE